MNVGKSHGELSKVANSNLPKRRWAFGSLLHNVLTWKGLEADCTHAVELIHHKMMLIFAHFEVGWLLKRTILVGTVTETHLTYFTSSYCLVWLIYICKTDESSFSACPVQGIFNVMKSLASNWASLDLCHWWLQIESIRMTQSKRVIYLFSFLSAPLQVVQVRCVLHAGNAHSLLR